MPDEPSAGGNDRPARESEVSRILDQLAREHSGDAWHGTPLRELLADVDAEQAAARPIAGGHTIWQIVLHMTAWKNEVRRRLGGEPAGTPAEGDWPQPPAAGAEAWRAAVDALEEAQRELSAVVARIPDSHLALPINDTRDPAAAAVSHYVQLHGIVQHDVYHSGQIALLKKARVRRM